MQPKKLLILLFSLLILATSTAIPTLAANTTDYDITPITISGGGEVVYSVSRAKTDTSPIYLLIESSTYYTTRVKALGTSAISATSANSYNCTCVASGTRVSYVSCNRGTDYSVHSYVKEDGYNRATLSFMNPYTGTQVLSGEWSLDSWNTHVDATP